VCGDTDVAHRLPAKQGNRQTSILVKLLRHWKKEEIMSARYKRRISALDLEYRGPDTTIYINDYLTVHNDSIAKRTRDMRREGKIEGAWTRDCKIFIRINQYGPAIMINNLNQLSEIEKVEQEKVTEEQHRIYHD
jgi:hypothetical protein